MTMNEKYFPKRARFIITNKLIDSIMNVSANFFAANAIYPSITMERKKLKKLKKKLDEGVITFSDVRNSYESWKGSLNGKKFYRTLQNMNKLFNELFIEDWRYEI